MSDEKLIEKDSAVEVVKAEAPVEKTEAVFTDTATEVKEEVKPKQVPLHELQKERNRRRAVEDEMSKLRKDLDELKSNYSKVSESQEEDGFVAEAEKELGVDREQARKLVNLTKKIVGSKAPQQQQNQDPLVGELSRFKQDAEMVAQDYDDWNDHTAAMQAIFTKELQENGLVAAKRSPHWYYNQAVKAKAESDKRSKSQRDAERAENANLAQTDSGSSTKGSGSTKLTQAVFDANRTNPKWVRENISEIRSLAEAGKLK